MRFVVVLLLALVALPLAAPVASAAAPSADHACCPQPPADQASTAPCQYVAPLGCCEQTFAPANASPDAPALRVLAMVAAPSPAPALLSAPTAIALRADHGPPQAPFLRVIVLQL